MLLTPNGGFVVAQLGARRHYAVPRILQQAGILERLYTDICATKGWPQLLTSVPTPLRSPGLRRLLARNPQGIPPGKITAFTSFGCEYNKRRVASRTRTETSACYLWAGREFCRRVVAEGLGEAAGVCCFNTAALEILQYAKAEGRRAVVEQTIAPKRIERALLSAEHERFPDWEEAAGRDELADAIIEREEAEWRAADLIVCGSEFVKEGIARCGGPSEKCVVVPYGVDVLTRHSALGTRHSEGPLRVLTVGAVGLRKGSPYILEAAKRLKGNAQFRLVGSIGVTRTAEAELRNHVELTGPVPRSEVGQHFQWAEVFLLPSICEGSATVTYEALAHGLPVICTPNTGSVVRDAVDGYIFSAGDVDALAQRVALLAGDKTLLRTLSSQARLQAARHNLETYGRRLSSTLTQDLTAEMVLHD